MATSKPKKRTDSFDRYARAIQDDIAALGKSMKEGFQSIREEMATKDDIRQVREQMVTKGEFKEVRDDVKRITDAMVSKADLEETIRDDFGKSRHAKHIEDLRSRVGHIEEKLGMKPTRHAGTRRLADSRCGRKVWGEASPSARPA